MIAVGPGGCCGTWLPWDMVVAVGHEGLRAGVPPGWTKPHSMSIRKSGGTTGCVILTHDIALVWPEIRTTLCGFEAGSLTLHTDFVLSGPSLPRNTSHCEIWPVSVCLKCITSTRVLEFIALVRDDRMFDSLPCIRGEILSPGNFIPYLQRLVLSMVSLTLALPPVFHL